MPGTARVAGRELVGVLGDVAERAKPPFRADHVGSLLRPSEIKEARAKVEGPLSPLRLTGQATVDAQDFRVIDRSWRRWKPDWAR